jgi:beta-lactamase class A
MLTVVLILPPSVASGKRAESVVYPTLADCGDNELQDALEEAVKNRLGDIFWNDVEIGNAALAVVDVTDLQQPKMADLNGNRMMYAASLPKLAILLGVFHLIDTGRLKYDAAIEQSLTRMIRYSSNQAATEMLNRVGFKRLAAILRSDRYRLYAQQYNGGLWVGRDYSGGRVWQRDPLHNVSHGATAFQTARFYYLLLTGQLVSALLTEDMFRILSDPAIEHKFVEGLSDESGVEIYRKSGTWRQYHADSGIVEYDAFKYIAVALVKDPHGDSLMTQLIDVIDDVVRRLHR